MTKKEESVNPLPAVEEIAKAIADISSGMRKLSSSRLNRKAIVVLLAGVVSCVEA